MTAGSVKRAGSSLAVAGDMTIDTAEMLLTAGIVAMKDGSAEFDLAAVEDVDSAGLAVLFGWQREAKSTGKTLRIANPPHSLISLAGVYDLNGLLPLA